MKEIKEEVLNVIKEADYVLVGCGSELSILNHNDRENYESNVLKPLNQFGIFNIKEYNDYVENDNIRNWLLSVLKKYYSYHYSGENIYNKLHSLIEDKNYFIITTNVDNLIFKSKLDTEKIVAPCGNDILLQCDNLCTNEIWDGYEYINNIISHLNNINEAIISSKWIEIEQQHYPKCRHCHGQAVFNVRSESNNYNEEGYMKHWEKYLNWLMRTLNRKIVMLELGEDFSNPTVIRWAFEKNTFINNKAKLIRVNKKFPQITEEIREKAISIPMSAYDFLIQQ